MKKWAVGNGVKLHMDLELLGMNYVYDLDNVLISPGGRIPKRALDRGQ